MEPENPPRRAKSGPKPVTIDLEANGADSRPADANPDTASATFSETRPSEEPTIENTPEPLVLTTDPATAPDPAAAEETRAGAVAEGAAADEESRAQAAASAFAEEPVPSRSTASASAENTYVPQKPSNSGPLAAGILGGLIALVGAGGLQYAGVFPSLGPGSDQTAIEQRVSGEIDALKAQIASASAAGSATDLTPLEGRIAALETASSEIGGQSGEIPGLKAQVTSLTDELAALKTQLADARQSTETAKTELSTRIEAAEKKIDEPASDVQLARAIAVTALKTAIDRGGPFLAELDALKSISPDDPAVAGLQPEAATGVAARADLSRDFPATADALLGAIRKSDPNQGVFGRLMDSASSMISVRPVGSVEGTGPDAVVARIENKLTNGDLKGASLEWEGLPQEAKAAGADFKTKLDQRIRVEGLIDTAVSGAMTANQG